jgi:hypothetical protein
MKLKLLSCLSSLVIAIIIAIGVNKVPQKQLSKITLANLEALAVKEVTLNCWETVEGGEHGETMTHKTYCLECIPVLCVRWSNSGTCSK